MVGAAETDRDREGARKRVGTVVQAVACGQLLNLRIISAPRIIITKAKQKSVVLRQP